MDRLRTQQNDFRFLNAFGASKRIGEADPPTCGFRINLYKVALATAAAILRLSSQQTPFCAFLFTLLLFPDRRWIKSRYALKPIRRASRLPKASPTA
ncbi:MAG: hypothetical protein WBW78_07880 [Terrimicrobiaceae bacterium]